MHYDVHVCPDVEMAELEGSLEGDCEGCIWWAVVVAASSIAV